MRPVSSKSIVNFTKSTPDGFVRSYNSFTAR
jgi:hypothetical protein